MLEVLPLRPFCGIHKKGQAANYVEPIIVGHSVTRRVKRKRLYMGGPTGPIEIFVRPPCEDGLTSGR